MYSICVFKWTSNFCVDGESSIAPVWVDLPQLPAHFFAQSSLFSIARVLKEPMRIDVATKMLTRPSVAQLCVEMDLLQKFSNRIWIGCGASGF